MRFSYIEAMTDPAYYGPHPFEIHVISGDAYRPDGIERLAAAGVTDVIVGFRNAYAVGQDEQSLDQKLEALRRYADTVIAKVR